MRNFITLDHAEIDATTDIFTLSTSDEHDHSPLLTMKTEGDYIAISASYGPIEIALRPRLSELKWALSHLQPIDVNTSRQVGSSQSYLALGLRTDGSLVIRPTILTDATGYIAFNLRLSIQTRNQWFDWMRIPDKS